jgi:hypothetical protein
VKPDLKVGSLLFSIPTGEPVVIVACKDSHRQTYGDGEQRKLYKLFEKGRWVWKHDIEIAAQYESTPRAPQSPQDGS